MNALMRRRGMMVCMKGSDTGRIYLLKDGVYDPIISGFAKKGFNNSAGTVTINSKVFVRASGGNSAATATTILAFDVTDKSMIGMKYTRTVEGTASNGMGFALLSDNVVNGNWGTSFTNKTSLSFTEENGYKIADISQLSGNKYLSFIVNTWGNSTTYSYDVSEIWIE